MTISDELKRLEELRIRGTLTDAEFQQAKQQVISGQTHSGQTHSGPATEGNSGLSFGALKSGPGMIMGLDEKTWCMVMHLSQLLVFSGLGIVVPVLMWLLGKDQSKLAEQHGARMMNWMISSLIYVLVAGILSIFMIGIPILIVLGILGIVFPIIAALKCSNGEVWSYPGAIKFISEE